MDQELFTSFKNKTQQWKPYMKKRRCQNQGLWHVWVSRTGAMDTAAFSLCSAAHVAVRCFSTVFQLPRLGCWRGTRAEKVQSLGWKYERRAAGLKVMIGLRGRQQRKTLHPPCAIRLALHNRPKWKRNLGFKYLWLFLGNPRQRQKKPVCMPLVEIC